MVDSPMIIIESSRLLHHNAYSVQTWLVFPDVHDQVCMTLPLAVEPLVISRQRSVVFMSVTLLRVRKGVG